MSNVCCSGLFSEKFNLIIPQSSLLISNNIRQSNWGHSISYSFCVYCKWTWPNPLRINRSSQFWTSIRIWSFKKTDAAILYRTALAASNTNPYPQHKPLRNSSCKIYTWYFWSCPSKFSVQPVLRIMNFYYVNGLIPSLSP